VSVLGCQPVRWLRPPPTYPARSAGGRRTRSCTASRAGRLRRPGRFRLEGLPGPTIAGPDGPGHRFGCVPLVLRLSDHRLVAGPGSPPVAATRPERHPMRLRRGSGGTTRTRTSSPASSSTAPEGGPGSDDVWSTISSHSPGPEGARPPTSVSLGATTARSRSTAPPVFRDVDDATAAKWNQERPTEYHWPSIRTSKPPPRKHHGVVGEGDVSRKPNRLRRESCSTSMFESTTPHCRRRILGSLRWSSAQQLFWAMPSLPPLTWAAHVTGAPSWSSGCTAGAPRPRASCA
jgi:hypothetical protein